MDAVPLESSVRLWHLPSSTLAPTKLRLACHGNPLGSRGGGAPHILVSGRCAVCLQLKSKWDESIFTKGCIQALEGWLPRNIYIVAGVFIAISLLQVRSPPLCGFLCPRGSHIFEPDHTWEDWWPHVELAGWWLRGGGGEGWQELCESEKPGVLWGTQDLGGEAGSPSSLWDGHRHRVESASFSFDVVVKRVPETAPGLQTIHTPSSFTPVVC